MRGEGPHLLVLVVAKGTTSHCLGKATVLEVGNALDSESCRELDNKLLDHAIDGDVDALPLRNVHKVVKQGTRECWSRSDESDSAPIDP